MTASTRVAPLRSADRFAWIRLATPLERGRLVILITLIMLTLGAWAVAVDQARTMEMPMGVVGRDAAMGGMGEMDDAGWSWGGATAFVVAWAVMMAAMMFPAAAPMILLFHAVHARQRATSGAFAPTWVFAAGYLFVWTTIGAVTYALVGLGSDLAGRLSAADRDSWAPPMLGATLVVAGLYQLTPLKRVCLDRCRSPLDFVMTHWREGYRGALRMGVAHGAYCLGCCWALFAVLVAAGVMSLAWMALLTLIVFAEKVLPVGTWAARITGAAFLALGIVVWADVVGMPWLA